VAEVHFEHDYYLPLDTVVVVYMVYSLGYTIEVRGPDNERISGVPALVGGGSFSFMLLPWAKEGVYVVKLFRHFVEVDSDQMSVGTILKKVVFDSSPSGAGVATKKL